MRFGSHSHPAIYMEVAPVKSPIYLTRGVSPIRKHQTKYITKYTQPLSPHGSAVVLFDSIEYFANARRPQLSDVGIKGPLMSGRGRRRCDQTKPPSGSMST